VLRQLTYTTNFSKVNKNPALIVLHLSTYFLQSWKGLIGAWRGGTGLGRRSLWQKNSNFKEVVK